MVSRSETKMDPEIICIDEDDEVICNQQPYQEPDCIIVYEKPSSRIVESRRRRRNQLSVLHRPTPSDEPSNRDSDK